MRYLIAAALVLMSCNQTLADDGEALAKDFGRALALGNLCDQYAINGIAMRSAIERAGFVIDDFSVAGGRFYEVVREKMVEVEISAHDAPSACSAGWLLFGEFGSERKDFIKASGN